MFIFSFYARQYGHRFCSTIDVLDPDLCLFALFANAASYKYEIYNRSNAAQNNDRDQQYQQYILGIAFVVLTVIDRLSLDLTAILAYISHTAGRALGGSFCDDPFAPSVHKSLTLFSAADKTVLGRGAGGRCPVVLPRRLYNRSAYFAFDFGSTPLTALSIIWSMRGELAVFLTAYLAGCTLGAGRRSRLLVTYDLTIALIAYRTVLALCSVFIVDPVVLLVIFVGSGRNTAA